MIRLNKSLFEVNEKPLQKIGSMDKKRINTIMAAKPEIYWIPDVSSGRLAIMPKPYGDYWLGGEIKAYKEQGIDTIVSFLTAGEEKSYGLEYEKAMCREMGIEFLSFPIRDHHVPDTVQEAIRFINALHDRLVKQKTIALHCMAGIGRSGMIAVALLIKTGYSTETACKAVSKARGLSVPETSEQKKWVKKAETLLINGAEKT